MKYLIILVMFCGCGTSMKNMVTADDIDRWDRCESIIMELQCKNISRNYDINSCRRDLMDHYIKIVNNNATELLKKTYLKYRGCPPWMVD